MSCGPLSRADKGRFCELEEAHEAHNHFGIAYESTEEQFAAVIPFVKRGLERGDRVVYAFADNTKARVRKAMRATGIPVDEARDAGQLRFRETRELYTSGGTVDCDQMLTTLEDALSETALDDQYSGFRIATEVTGEFLDDIDTREFLAAEAEVNHLFEARDFFALCQYDRDSISPHVVEATLQTHPVLAYRDVIGPNTYYRPPSEFDFGSSPDVLSKLEAHRAKLEAQRERQRHERGISALAEATRELVQADRSTLPERVATTAHEVASFDAVALWLYDSETDGLDLQTTACAESVTDAVDLSQYAEVAWRAFVTSEVQHRSASENGTTPPEPPLRSVAALPIDGEGTLLVGTSDAERLEGQCLQVARALTRTLRVALEWAQQECHLATTRESVSKLETVNTLVRELTQAIIDASRREDIEQALCETVTDLEGFAFAWVGDVDPNEVTVSPRAWAGAEQGYLTDIADADTRCKPAVAAADSGNVCVVSNIADHPSDAWREAMLARDFRSAASVPLASEGISYGVATIYATQSGVFDQPLEDVLTELGRFIGHMVTSVEQEAAFRTRRTRELEVELAASNFPLVELAQRADCTVETDEFVLKTDTEVLAVGDVRGATPARLAEAAEAAVNIEAADVVPVADDTVLLDLTLTKRCIGMALASHGADLRSIRADPDAAYLFVRIDESIDAHTVVDAIADRYPEPTLVASRQPSPSSQHVLPTDIRDRLTDRQQEVAAVAYRAGYFESPRRCTGEDVADVLDISPQAFYQHVRRIQGTLFETIVEE